MQMIRDFAVGKYAIAVSGSIGKGYADERSDVDFRLYADEFVTGERWDACFAEYMRLLEVWKRRGVMIDGVWMRTNEEVTTALDRWLAGDIEPDRRPIFDWAIWGYHLPTDIYNQCVLEDPDGVAEGWKERMRPYPDALRQAILKRYLARLLYWREDYHYRSKVEREDVAFLGYISASIVHDIMQVLFALNRVYFSGDGHNLSYAKNFALQPADLAARVESVLYPDGPGKQRAQYQAILALISDVAGLVES